MARYHIGVIYERRGDLAEAEREFRRSLDEGIEEASSLYHLARILEDRGDSREAEELLQRARQFGKTEA